MKNKVCCLCLIEDKETNRLLMVRNKRGVNSGMKNFPGGKIESTESIEEGCIREVFEETGVEPLDLQSRGKVVILPANVQIHVFYTDKFCGSLNSADGEVEAFWQSKDEIPYEQMRNDCKFWADDVLLGKSVYKNFHVNENWEIEKIEDLSLIYAKTKLNNYQK